MPSSLGIFYARKLYLRKEMRKGVNRLRRRAPTTIPAPTPRRSRPSLQTMKPTRHSSPRPLPHEPPTASLPRRVPGPAARRRALPAARSGTDPPTPGPAPLRPGRVGRSPRRYGVRGRGPAPRVHPGGSTAGPPTPPHPLCRGYRLQAAGSAGSCCSGRCPGGAEPVTGPGPASSAARPCAWPSSPSSSRPSSAPLAARSRLHRRGRVPVPAGSLLWVWSRRRWRRRCRPRGWSR